MQIDNQIKLILNATLLGLYALLLVFGLIRITTAFIRSKKFIAQFFLLVLVATSLELGIQIYQVI